MTHKQVSRNEKLRALCSARDAAILVEHDERAFLLRKGYAEGARKKLVSVLTQLLATKFKTPLTTIEPIICSENQEKLDNLVVSIFSIESIDELRAFLKQH